jgi:hypothetical protein
VRPMSGMSPAAAGSVPGQNGENNVQSKSRVLMESLNSLLTPDLQVWKDFKQEECAPSLAYTCIPSPSPSLEDLGEDIDQSYGVSFS